MRFHYDAREMMRKGIVVALALCTACAQPTDRIFRLSSTDIQEGSPMAREFYYTRCGGRNISPELSWSGPRNVTSYALTLIDRTVSPNNWSHWVVLDIPGNVRELPRGAVLPAGATPVASNFGDLTYDGPCPPAGTGVHRYDFTIYAFNRPPPRIGADANAKQLAARLSTASIARATLSVTAVDQQ